MSGESKTFITPEEYLKFELQAETKHEYFNGEIFAMSGASERHVSIVTNLVINLGVKLRGRPCKVYSTDLRLRVNPTGLYTYPDVIVVCGERRFAENQKDTLLNPTLIIEVLSESTKDYDRGEKFTHYRTIDSLAEYITIAQDKPHVEHHTRQAKHSWLLVETKLIEDRLHLSFINCDLSLTDIYDDIDFAPENLGAEVV